MDIAKYLPYGAEDENNNGFVDKRKNNGSKAGIAKARQAKKSKVVQEYEILSETDEESEEPEEVEDEIIEPPKPVRTPKNVKKPRTTKKKKATIQDYQAVASPYMMNEELKQIKSIVADLSKAKKKTKPKVKKASTIIQVGAQQALPSPIQTEAPKAKPAVKQSTNDDYFEHAVALKKRILLNF